MWPDDFGSIDTMASWKLIITEGTTELLSAELSGPLEVGRQDQQDPTAAPPVLVTSQQPARLVIASRDEQTISRKHILLEPRNGDRIRTNNLSKTLPLRFAEHPELPPGASREVSLPISLVLGRRTLRIAVPTNDEPQLNSLPASTLAPGSGLLAPRVPPIALRRPQLDPAEIVPWMQQVLNVFQSAATSGEFFQLAAQAAVDMVGLDAGRVLIRDKENWRIEAQAMARGLGDEVWQPSRQVLARVLEAKRTFWELPRQSVAASLMSIRAVVAAPILDRRGEVIAVLYGDRKQDGVNRGAAPLSQLEAQLVELLATGVAAGLARMEQEQAALAARVQFEQFFTPELARHLAEQPDLLDGRDTEVTILFCDIRGFSRISERHPPAVTLEWIADTMTTLSECVRQQGGVLVDYIGDELMAMWGAPERQPDHAARACAAGRALLACVPLLNERWQAKLGESIRIGIGINTGVARVGNTGSRYKFKYGPLGKTVNLASRVQGATKYLHAPALVTANVVDSLREAKDGTRSEASAFRRLCRVRVVNMAEPVELHELMTGDRELCARLKADYERALAAFEAGRFHEAATGLGSLLGVQPKDGPSIRLMARAVECLLERPEEFDPVWELPGK
jgi:adenylate cyclase